MAPGDLPRRLGVAVVGIPAVVGLLFLGGWFLAVPIAALSALAAGEVYALGGRSGVRALSPLGMGAAAALVLAAGAGGSLHALGAWAAVILLGLALAAGSAAIWARGVQGAPLAAVSVTVFGAAYAGLSLAFVPLLHGLPGTLGWGGADPSRWVGAFAVILPLASTWIGDAAAYFAGSAYGRAKLIPAVSPNKSWVGLWAGMVGGALGALAWGVLASSVFQAGPLADAGAARLGMVALAGGLLGLAALLGDLVESLLKREAGVKDSGTFFPGHGGVLDRLDALTFTLPLSYGVLVLFELLP